MSANQNPSKSRRVAGTLAGAAVLFGAGAARGAPTDGLHFTTTVDTTNLIGNATGPFTLDFQFVDGGQLNNNSATLSNFTFGTGGAATGASSLIGDATGDLNGTITFADSTFFSDFDQTFTPGTTLSFTTDLTTGVDTGDGTSPDQFSFAILDGGGNELTTTDSSGTNTIFAVNLDSATPTLAPSSSSTGAFGPVVISSAVPEPASVAVIGLVTAGALLRRRREPA